MTTAVLNEKRYTLSFACLVAAIFWAGIMLLSMRVLASTPEQSSDMPPCAVVKKDA